MSYNPAVDRTTLVEGPAHIILPDGTTYLWTDGAVNVDLVTEFTQIEAAGFGAVVVDSFGCDCGYDCGCGCGLATARLVATLVALLKPPLRPASDKALW